MPTMDIPIKVGKSHGVQFLYLRGQDADFNRVVWENDEVADVFESFDPETASVGDTVATVTVSETGTVLTVER